MDEAIGEKVWQVRADLLYRQLADGGMLYDSASGQVHHLNATAALVWEACQAGKKTAETVAELCRCYEVEIAQAGADVREILQAFVRAELLAP